MANNKDIKLVVMSHSREDGTTGPATADVHPDEVANYELGGWTVEASVGNWDPSAKLDDLIEFAARLPGFDLAPELKKKADIIAAVEGFLAAQEAEANDWDPENMDLQQMYEFAFANNLDVDLGIDDKAELQQSIEDLLSAAAQE